MTQVGCSSVIINNSPGEHTWRPTVSLTDLGNSRDISAPLIRIENFTERKNGFQRAVREHGMSVGKSISHELSPSIEGALSDMLEIIDRGDHLAECYFADNDLIAIGAIKALKLRGYSIPEDIAIIGFDNITEGKVIDPALTTIEIPPHFTGTDRRPAGF